MKNKIAIHCPTKDLWDKVQEKAFGKLQVWGKFYGSTDNYGEEPYDTIQIATKCYCYKTFYEKDGYTIIPAKEWLAELKVGDSVEVVSGGKYIGAKGEILRCGYSKFYPIDVSLDCYGYTSNFNPKDLKLIESEDSMKEDNKLYKACKDSLDNLWGKEEYSVPLREGDKVRVLEGDCVYPQLKEEEGVVIDLNLKYDGGLTTIITIPSKDRSYTIATGHLQLIPTEKDIVVGSVWRGKNSGNAYTVSRVDNTVHTINQNNSKLEYAWSSKKGLLDVLELIHRGDEESGSVTDGVIHEITKEGISCCTIEHGKMTVSVFKPKTNKKEKKMKTKVISVGLEIMDKACSNLGKVAYYNEGTGKVAYEEADGSLTVGHIDNIILAPVSVILPKPKPVAKKKKVVKKKAK